MSRFLGWNPLASSSSPQTPAACAAAHSAPGPQASTSILGAAYVRWMVDGPSGVPVARHASLWWTLIERPSPIGASVENISKGRAVSNEVRTCGSTRVSSLLPERDLQDERAAASDIGLDGQVSVVHAGYLTRQPEPEAGALDVLGALHPAEPGEKLELVRRADPRPAVNDRHGGHPVVAPYANGDVGARGRVL